jgi:hypothetical protein
MYLNVKLLFLSLFVFTGYLLFISVKYRRLESISASFYALPERHRYVFTLALWGFAMPVMMASTSAFQFLAGAGICFVGAAAAYKEELTNTVHYAGAVSGIVFGMIHLVIVGLWYMAAIYGLFFVLALLKSKRPVFWVEVVAFYIIVVSLIVKSL